MTKQSEHFQCYHVKTGDDEWVHIPGCWAAVQDPNCCTCNIGGSELERAQRGRSEAEEYIEKLLAREAERTERLNTMHRYNYKLHARIRELEALL